MNRKLLLFILSAAAVTTGASAFAGEIYKYVDEDGGVHYLDRPTGESGEERFLTIRESGFHYPYLLKMLCTFVKYHTCVRKVFYDR